VRDLGVWWKRKLDLRSVTVARCLGGERGEGLKGLEIQRRKRHEKSGGDGIEE
jgi:hypothetical protein